MMQGDKLKVTGVIVTTVDSCKLDGLFAFEVIHAELKWCDF